MPKVGNVVEINSDTYGTYYQTCICLLDLINGNPLNNTQPNVDDVMAWLDEYHPKHYFRSYGCKSPDKDNNWKFYVFVVLDRHNQNWTKENASCKYMKSVSNNNSIKKIPIGISDTKLSKWLSQSFPYIVEAIEV